MEKQAYSIKETATLIGICKGTVRNLIKQGKLRTVSPSPRRIIIPLESIKAYLNDRA